MAEWNFTKSLKQAEGLKIAILGATGAVGTQILRCLEERSVKVRDLVLLASKRSEGTKISFNAQDYFVREARPEEFEGVDIVFGASSDELAQKLLPEAVKRGAICIDNSHAFRLEDTVPLVVPEINAFDIAQHQGIIANPNCATIIALVAVWPLHKLGGLKSMVVSTYQAASGAGEPGMRELERQTKDYVEHGSVHDIEVFQHQLLYNLIPQIGSANESGYTSEERKLQNEGRKICHLPNLRVSCTCVRVPVARSHSESICCQFEKPVSVEAARQALQDESSLVFLDEVNAGNYPMPLVTSDRDEVFVGRIREDLVHKGGINLWCCGDQIRKGAATNAVQILQELIRQNL